MSARLIGGEMMVWSDLDGRHGPGPASAPTLRPLLASISGRTLVAGPHAPELLDSLPSSQLTLLARGRPDADLLAGRFAGIPGVTVLCGSLEKLAAEPAYDTVVALDGLGRLRSAEDDATDDSWAGDLARLVAVLRPGGRLLLGLENLFGLHRLLTPAPEPADADWSAANEFDPTRPASPTQLRSALTAAGLEVLAGYAAFPESSRASSPAGGPSVLLGAALLADPARRGWTTATVRASLSSSPWAPADPDRIAPESPPSPVRAVPESLAVPGRTARESLDEPGRTVPESLADPGRIVAGAVRAGIAGELAPGWIVVARRGPGPEARFPVVILAGGGNSGDISEISGGDAVPVGPTLDELLLGASLRRDLPALRELLVDWQSGDSAGVPAEQIVAAPDGTRTALVPAGDPVAALHRLAATMIRDGHAYLWPAPADVAELTALLAAMAGREAPELPAPPPAAESRRELVMERDRLARELAEVRAAQQWYETLLLGREAELKRVRRINTMLLATLPGKAAKASYGSLRKARQALRRRRS